MSGGKLTVRIVQDGKTTDELTVNRDPKPSDGEPDPLPDDIDEAMPNL